MKSETSVKQRVGIIGVTGYTGAELVRIVHAHPQLELVYVAARETAGQTLGQALPSTRGVPSIAELVIETFEPEQAPQLARRMDVVFTALPHGASARAGAALYDAGLIVVDLSADYRLRDVATYEKWYGAHPKPEHIAAAVYGQPEWHAEELRGARLIAAPGCYPTSAIVALAPLLEASLIEVAPIIIDAKSGVSGAGKAPSQSSHFPEAAEGLRPYKVAGTHRHIPEIEQELSRAAKQDVQVTFTPHLVPMSRGILTTAYARLRKNVSAEDCRAAATAKYASGLVTVLPADTWPDTLFVRGSARAQVGYAMDARTHMVVAVAAIDNLARGASAQAVQALNLSLGWPGAAGLPQIALYP